MKVVVLGEHISMYINTHYTLETSKHDTTYEYSRPLGLREMTLQTTENVNLCIKKWNDSCLIHGRR